MDPALLVETQHGFGDCLYARHVVGSLAACGRRVFVRTPWPQAFRYTDSGFDVRFLRWESHLRTQAANLRALEAAGFPFREEAELGTDFVRIRPTYTREVRAIKARETTLLAAIERSAGALAQWRHLVADADSIAAAGALLSEHGIRPGRFALVKYPTTRQEWWNVSRNPAPYVMSTLVHAANSSLPIVSVANVEPSVESFVEDVIGRPSTVRFDRGELSTGTLIALAGMARLVITSPCFMLPLALASETPVALCIGGHIAGELLVDPAIVRSPLLIVQPDEVCNCVDDRHDCPKEIRAARLTNAAREVARWAS